MRPLVRLARWLNPTWHIFRGVMAKGGARRRADHPGLPGAFAFSEPRWEGGAIHGWAARQPPATGSGSGAGTVVLVHGFREHSLWSHTVALAERAFHGNGWSVAAFDLRMHGRSHDGQPGFGLAESWDLAAVLDHLERAGFPRPFVALGTSLGAMAVANLAARDPRLAGVFLESQPAGPRLALAAAIAARTANPVARTVMRWLSELINLWYGQDVLGAGDLLRLPPPAHRPLVVMTIGTADHYGFAATRALFQAVWGGGDEQVIHQGVSGTWTWSGEHPLLLVCDGADHYSDSLGYPDVLRAFDELLRAACTRAPGRDGPLTPAS